MKAGAPLLMARAQVVTLDKTGHREPLRGVLYNSTFHVIVSVDEGGTVCVWRMQDGSREGRFSNAHGGSKVGGKSRLCPPCVCLGARVCLGDCLACWLRITAGGQLVQFANSMQPSASGPCVIAPSFQVTALSFDKNERRLVTAANDASIRMWNFNNGSLLRT